MHVYIDPHLIANVAAFVVILGLCLAWGWFFRRLIGFIALIGLSATVIAMSRSDLVPASLQTIALTGMILTAIATVGIALTIASVKRARLGRMMRQVPPRQRALVFAGEQSGQQQRARDVPPVVFPRKTRDVRGGYVEDEGYEDEDDLEEDDGGWYYEEDVVPAPSVPARSVEFRPIRHSAANRARPTPAAQQQQSRVSSRQGQGQRPGRGQYRVVPQQSQSRAARARLQGR